LAGAEATKYHCDVTKIEEIEGKLRKLVEQFNTLRHENQKLRSAQEATRSTLEILTSENQKAQEILSEFQQLKKRQDQAVLKVEKALKTLNALRS